MPGPAVFLDSSLDWGTSHNLLASFTETTFTCGSPASSVLLVTLYVESTVGNTPGTPTVTWDGVSMTLIGAAVVDTRQSSAPAVWFRFGLIAPHSGLKTLSVSGLNAQCDTIVCYTCWGNADQAAVATTFLPWNMIGSATPLVCPSEPSCSPFPGDADFATVFSNQSFTITSIDGTNIGVNTHIGGHSIYRVGSSYKVANATTYRLFFNVVLSGSSTNGAVGVIIRQVQVKYLDQVAFFESFNVNNTTPPSSNPTITLNATQITYSGGNIQSALGINLLGVGRWYAEFTFLQAASGGNVGFGFARYCIDISIASHIDVTADSVGVYDDSNVWTNSSNQGAWSPGAVALNNVVAVCFDNTGATPKIWAKNLTQAGGWNNGAIGSQNPAVGSQVGGYNLSGWTNTSSGDVMIGATVTGTVGFGLTINCGQSKLVGVIPNGFSLPNFQTPYSEPVVPQMRSMLCH